MELFAAVHYQGKKYWEKVAPTPVGRGLRHGGDVASEGVSYAYGNIPRALAWAVPNALWTGLYVPLAAYSLVAKAYNAAWGTQHGGRNDGNRHWYNHWKRMHLTGPSYLRPPGTGPSWTTVCRIVPGPDWHAPAYPPPPADPKVFDPTEQYTGLKKGGSPEWYKGYTEYVANAMLTDAGRLGHLIRTEVFPPGHPHAGQPRYGNLSEVFRIAHLQDCADGYRRIGDPASIAISTQLRNIGNGRAQAAGFADLVEAATFRTTQMDRLMSFNAMHYTNVEQLGFEMKEAQETLKLIVEMHRKDFWYKLKWGYLNYDSGHKSAAEKSDSRLRGLLQEVDPLDSRRQKGPFHI